MDQPETQSQPPQRRRRRPALVCVECRRRKIKCDRNEPCAHCVRNKTQCIFRPFGNSIESMPGTITTGHLPPSAGTSGLSEPAPTPSTNSGHSLDGGTRSSQNKASAVASVTAQRNTDTTNHEPSSGLPHPSSDLSQSDALTDLLRRVQKLEDSNLAETRTGHDRASSLNSVPTRLGADFEDSTVRKWQVVLNKPRDFGKTRPMGKAPEFDAVISCYGAIVGQEAHHIPVHEPRAATLIAQASESLLKCKNIARRLKMGSPSRSLPNIPADRSLRPNLSLPSREMADTMAKAYFEYFESTHRIIHVPTFWLDYQRYWDQPDTITNSIRFQVLLVVAIGSSMHDHRDSNAALQNMEMVQPWIHAAEAWLAGPLEKDRLDIAGLQIYCLNILARQIFSIGGDLIWISMGSLVHRAMQIGLHRDPKHLPPVSVLKSEIRRRLWATILDLSVQASLDAWMPPRISFDEFDTQPPSNVNDDEMDEATGELIPQDRTIFTTTSAQLALLDSFPIRLRIVKLLNGLQSEPSYSDVLSLSSKLSEALQTTNNLPSMASMTPFHRSLIDYLARRFMIPLNYSFSHQALSNPLYHYSLKLSLDTALALVSPDPNPDPSRAFTRLLILAGGLFRQGLRSAITAITLELLTHVRAQQQNGTLHRAPQYRELIKGSVRDLIALSEERIRFGETNVKAHMFLSMILAQVEALEAGGEGDVQLAIAESAADSLRASCGILSARAEVFLPVGDSELAGAWGGGIEGSAPDESRGNVGFDNYGMDWDWESLFPDAGFPLA